MIRVVDFKPEHLEQISPKSCHTGEVPKTVMTFAVTMIQDEKPIAIFGCFTFVSGVHHIWGFLSDDVRKAPIAFHKACISFLGFFIEKYRPQRLQIDVRVDYPEGIKWAETFGFKKEGLMKSFGSNGLDHWLMGRAI